MNASAQPTLAVYTALFGNYEALIDQPIRAQSAAAFICFTDNPELTSDTWEIRVVQPTVPWDSTRMARKVKISGYASLDVEQTVWIDNRIVLKKTPEELVAIYLEGHDIALPLHDHRASVRDEYAEVIAAGVDQAWPVREQLYYMERFAPDALAEVPYWTAIILRRNTPVVHGAMEIWIDHVLRHSRRDQLSVNYALGVSAARVNAIQIPNRESYMHSWLRIEVLSKRKDVLFDRGFRYRIRTHLRDFVFANRYSINLRTRWRSLRSRLSRASMKQASHNL